MKLVIAITGMLATASVGAQQQRPYELRLNEAAYSQVDNAPAIDGRRQAVDLGIAYSVPLTRRSALFGSVGLPGEPALGPPPSYMRRFASLDESQPAPFSERLDFQGVAPEVFTLGYRWRNVALEGSAFSTRIPDEQRVQPEPRKIGSRSGRLSISPAPNLSLQLSRGTISNLDQLEPNGEVRRTTLSATYKRAFKEAEWQTTLAWGRNARRYRESTYGYLFESSLRVANAHAFFGRVEQVGSDDILRANDSNGRQMFKMNKLTVGYVYDMRATRHLGMDVGGLLSRHYVPSNMAPTYGNDPVSYMMFVRFKLK
jgi:hypothetical protein